MVNDDHFTSTERAWMYLAGLDFETSGLPRHLFRELYSDILTYGPEAEAILDFVKTVKTQDPKSFLASIDYTMGGELQPFEKEMSYFLSVASRRPKAVKLTDFILDAIEDEEITKYKDLWNNVLSLSNDTVFNSPVENLTPIELRHYVQLLNMACWSLIGDEVFPPRAEVEKFRAHLKPLTIQYLESLPQTA